MRLKITSELAQLTTKNYDTIEVTCSTYRSGDNRAQYIILFDFPPGWHTCTSIRSGVGDKPEPKAGLRACLSFLLASLETYHRIEREGRSPTREEWGELGFSPATIEWADNHEDELTEAHMELTEE
jgi:hypothetical protein